MPWAGVVLRKVKNSVEPKMRENKMEMGEFDSANKMREFHSVLERRRPKSKMGGNPVELKRREVEERREEDKRRDEDRRR